MYSRRRRFAAVAFLLMAAATAYGAAPVDIEAKVEVIQTPRSIVIGLRDLDLVRRAAPNLRAVVLLKDGENRPIDTFALDYTHPVAQSHVVFRKRPDAAYAQVEIQFTSDAGASSVKRALPPSTESAGRVALLDEIAHLEPGTAFDKGTAPAIRLPDFTKAAAMKLAAAPRSVDLEEARHRVTADCSFPMTGVWCYVLPRAGSDDPKAWSLYIPMNNDLYDEKTGALESPFKYMAELSIDPDWLSNPQDQTVTVPWDKVRLHMTTEEIEVRRLGKQRITGNRKGLLPQSNQGSAIDEDGNVYFAMAYGSPIRFNVKKAKWEAPPVNVYDFHLRYKPKPEDLPYPKDEVGDVIRTDFANDIYYHNGRIWVLMARNEIIGKGLLLASVVSIPVAHWDDPKAFEAGMRFNAGCFPGAAFPLWNTYVSKDDSRRRLKYMMGYGRRIHLLSYHKNYFWIMQVGDDGSTEKLTPITTLNGKPIEEFSAEMAWVVRGEAVLGLETKVRVAGETASRRVFLPLDADEFIETFPDKAATQYATGYGGYKQRNFLWNAAGTYGKFTSAKSTLCQRMGRPQIGGKLTIYYDSMTKMFREPGPFADVVARMRAASMGPEYYVVPTPDDTMEVLGVADYPKYNFARYDCAPGVETVKRTFLLQQMDEKNVPPLSLPAGLGPGCHRWVREGGDDVLYYAGYTGVARLCYRIGGKVPERHQVEVLKLPHQSADGTAGASPPKWFRDMRPGLGDRMFLTGVHQTSRGGTAYNGGLMYFERGTPDRLSMLSGMSRSYNTDVLAGRLLAEPGGRLTQDILLGGNYNASAAGVLPEGKRPGNIKPRVFVYRDAGADGVQDRFGFTLAPAAAEGAGLRDITMAANGLYLIVLMRDGALATFDVDAMRFVDAVRVPPLFASFIHDRHHTAFLNLPDGSCMLGLLERENPDDVKEEPKAGAFVRIEVNASGRISVTPHLRCSFASSRQISVPLAFVYDAHNNDGSYDAVFGPNAAAAEGAVRIVRDFIPFRK